MESFTQIQSISGEIHFRGLAVPLLDCGGLHGRTAQRIPDKGEHLVRLDPNNAKAYYNRGVAYQNIGEKAKTAADIAKAKELGFLP